MANKRDLKKYILNLTGSLAFNCMYAAETVNGIDQEAADKVIDQISVLQQASLRRVSFAFDKKVADFDSRHAYNLARHAYNTQAYRVLVKEFNEKVAEIVKQMNALLPASQREINKKLAQA